MECKVKIGSLYEPKWFERRYTQGTYSAKGIAHDAETIWIQQVMLGRSFKRRSYAGRIVLVACVFAIFLFAYGA